LEIFSGRDSASFKAVVTYMFSVESEFALVLKEVFAVLLGEALQAGVTLEV
jgi:hypothetical protein